jgi:hypothetical protein
MDEIGVKITVVVGGGVLAHSSYPLQLFKALHSGLFFPSFSQYLANLH